MKKLLCAIITLTLVVLPFTINVSATDLDTKLQLADNQQIAYYEDGSYAIITIFEEINTQTRKASIAAIQTSAGSKSYVYYNSNDELQWTAKVRGEFTYNGSSATCTQSTVSTSIYNNKWKATSAVASKSGATATGDFVFKYYTLLIPIKTVNVHLTITCSANGVLT